MRPPLHRKPHARTRALSCADTLSGTEMTTETSSSSGLDHALFRPEAIAAETAQFNEQLRELMAGTPAIHKQEPREIRAGRTEGGGPFGEIVRLDHAEERSGYTASAPCRSRSAARRPLT